MNNNSPPKRTTTVRYVAVLRDGVAKVLTVALADLSLTMAHERRIGSVTIGEYGDKHLAERAARLGARGWRRCPDARKQA
jgi:hypothetical protein